MFAAVMNALFAPFIASYFLVLFLFRNLHVGLLRTQVPRDTKKCRISSRHRLALAIGSTPLSRSGNSASSMSSGTCFKCESI